MLVAIVNVQHQVHSCLLRISEAFSNREYICSLLSLASLAIAACNVPLEGVHMSKRTSEKAFERPLACSKIFLRERLSEREKGIPDY